MAVDAVNQSIDRLISAQAVMLATNQVMAVIGIVFILAAAIVWLAPKATRSVDPTAGGH